LQCVTDTRKIQGDLLAANEQIKNSQQATGAADHAVAQVQQRVAATGFQGIAARLGPVRQGLSEVQRREASAARSIEESARQAATVTVETTPQQAISRLSPIVEGIDQALNGVRGAAEQLTRLEHDVAAALQGGQPQQLQAAIRRPKDMLTQPTVAALNAAKTATQEVITQARQAGSGGPR
jgi:hypothetical protein